MIFCAGFIVAVIVLEAGPVYTRFMKDLLGEGLSFLQRLWFSLSFGLVAALSVEAVYYP